MDSLAWVCASLATLFLILSLSTHFPRRKKLNLPRGPKPWPVIGNLHLVGPLPHRSLHALSQKHGPIMQLRFGSTTVVAASSASPAKLFLKTHDLVFASRPRPPPASTPPTTAPTSRGPRKALSGAMCLKELFSPKRLDSMCYIRREEVMELLKGLYGVSGEAVKVKDHLRTAGLNVISRMVLGKKYLDPIEGFGATIKPEEFQSMLDELLLLNGVLNIGDSGLLGFAGLRKEDEAVAKKFDAFMETVLNEHDVRRKEAKDYVAKDMLNVLLQVADDPDLEVKLERHEIKAISQVLGTLS